MLQSKYLYNPERREWMGVVFDPDKKTILTFACCETEQAIIHWLNHYVETGEELPDIYDGANNAVDGC